MRTVSPTRLLFVISTEAIAYGCHPEYLHIVDSLNLVTFVDESLLRLVKKRVWHNSTSSLKLPAMPAWLLCLPSKLELVWS